MNHQQPGLQVAYETGLQPWDEYYAPGKEATPPAEHVDHSHYHSASGSDAPEIVTSETRPRQPSGKRKQTFWIIGALVALVVILAAVLGGVLGSRAARSSSGADQETKPTGNGTDSNTSPTVNPTSTNETTVPSSKTIRQGSSLAVTGWRNIDGLIEKFLFFQSPQDGLYMMEWGQSQSGSNGTWKAPVSFNASAKPDTRLSASLIVWGTYFTPQIELFYTGKSSRLLGASINDQTVPKFGDDSINSFQVLTGVNSSLSSYWPWTIQQDSDGALRHVRNKLGSDGYSPQSNWDVNRIGNITAARAPLPGTSLAIVPMSTNFEWISWKAGYGVFYQGIDGRLYVQVTDLYSPDLQAEEGYHLSWPVELPLITVPERTPIAAFSVARGNGDKNERVNTYVLYIDEKHNINVLYTDTSKSIDEPVWKIVQPKEMQGVDEDSSLACLTMATSPGGPTGGPIPLEPGTEETMRCYFMRDGKVVEAMLKTATGTGTGTGTDWRVVGSLPIP